MPEVIPIIIAAVSAVGLGESIYAQVNKPGAPKAPTASQLAAQNRLSPAQLASAVRGAKGDVQASTSGGVSPDYLSQLIQTQYGSQAGNPGVVNQQASSQWSGGSFGSPGGTGPGAGGLPFGNASNSGLNSSGIATPGGSSGFNLSDWFKQLQEGAPA